MPTYIQQKPEEAPRKDSDREAKVETKQKDVAQKPVTYTDFASI